jgi:predicted nucleic acid-binding Zn ribbon protein
VRRTVGIAALKRIRRIVDAENALEADKRRWARRFGIAFALAAALVLAWMLIR